MVDGMGATLSFQDALNETGRMSSITEYSETPTLWHTQASEGEVRLYRVTARQIKWDIPDEIRDPPHDVDFPVTPPPRTNLHSEFNGPSCRSELCHIFLDRPVLGYQDASHHCRYVSLLSGAKAFLLIPASSFHIDVSAGELSMTRAKTD